MTIRAVHILRDDADARFGGDVVHLHALVDAVGAHGIDAVAATWDVAPATADVVHLWNLDLPFALRDHAEAARRRWPGAAVVVTPIFWPWPLGSLLRARDPSIWYRAARNGAKAWVSWPAVRRTLAGVDSVIACSGRELALLSRYYRLPRPPTWSAAPTGVWAAVWGEQRAPATRAAVLAEAGLPHDTVSLVVCAGRLEPLKNQRTLVRAVSAVPGAALVLVGAASDRRYTTSVLDAATDVLPGRFAWLGRRPQDEVRRLLAAADVHALVSYREVASLSSLEAAASGSEVVVSRWSSAEEYFGDLAHLCDADDEASVVTALERARAAPRQPALQQLVAGSYDWSVAGRMVAERYEDVVARRGR